MTDLKAAERLIHERAKARNEGREPDELHLAYEREMTILRYQNELLRAQANPNRFGPIQTTGTYNGRVNLWCSQHAWWMRDQLAADELPRLLEMAIEHLEAEQHTPVPRKPRPKVPEGSQWVHGTRLGRDHTNLSQHLIEDHGEDPARIEALSDGGVHGLHDGAHGVIWSYAKDLMHPARNETFTAPCTGESEPDGIPCTGVLTFSPGEVQAKCPECGGWTGREAPPVRASARLVKA